MEFWGWFLFGAYLLCAVTMPWTIGVVGTKPGAVATSAIFMAGAIYILITLL